MTAIWQFADPLEAFLLTSENRKLTHPIFMRIKFEIRNVSEVAGDVNDLFLSRVQDLCIKALQSLFSLFGLAPSFLASPLATPRVIRIARSTIPKKMNNCSQSIFDLINQSGNVTPTPESPPADIIVVSKSFDRTLDIIPLINESAHMDAAAEPVELLSTHPEGRLSPLYLETTIPVTVLM